MKQELKESIEYIKSALRGKKYDILLINASPHKTHNTSYMVSIAEKTCKRLGASYWTINLSDYKINDCIGCYSVRESACHLPCTIQDDMELIYPLLFNTKAIIIATPVHWLSMSSLLKKFIDRLTCIQNLYLLKFKGNLPLAGKAIGILVNAHEDGSFKTAFEVFFAFQQMGYILAPFGIAYHNSSRDLSLEKDNKLIRENTSTKKFVEAVTENVIHFTRLNCELKMKICNSCM